MNKTDILRREGGIAKHFDLRLAGRRLRIVYAYDVEPPLARRGLATQVFSCYGGYFAAFMAVHGCFGGLHVTRCPRLNFNKTKHIGIPADQVDFPRLPRRAVVAGHDDITQAAEMEAGVLLAAPPGALMRRPLVRRQSMTRQPVEAADGCVGEAAGKQDWAPGDAN
jgi:hypothetical protein